MQRYEIPSPLASKQKKIFLSSEQMLNDAGGGINTYYKSTYAAEKVNENSYKVNETWAGSQPVQYRKVL